MTSQRPSRRLLDRFGLYAAGVLLALGAGWLAAIRGCQSDEPATWRSLTDGDIGGLEEADPAPTPTPGAPR